jgi:tetratricopeptide (TPR) repeat protein
MELMNAMRFMRFLKRHPTYTADTSTLAYPLQRPPRSEYFIGRERDLTTLLNSLDVGRVVTLVGPGGIGKTALAIEAIWQLAPDTSPPRRFPHGIIWHNFYSEPSAAQAAQHIALAMGIEPGINPFVSARQAVAKKRVLIFLDGTEAADDIRKILAICPESGVLMTSRRRDDAPTPPQDILPLSVAESIQLFDTWVGARTVDRAVAERICALLGGLPLAIRLAGHYLSAQEESESTYLEWLRDTSLKALDQGSHRSESVPLLLEKSVAQLTPGARRAIAVVGLFAQTPFDKATVTIAMSENEHSVTSWLQELTNYGLLLTTQGCHMVSHPLIHTYCRGYTAPTYGADATMARLTRYYVRMAEEERASSQADYHRLGEYRLHIMAILQRLAENDQWGDALELAWLADWYLEIRGYWSERTAALEIGLKATQGLAYRQDEGKLLGILGTAYYAQGVTSKAITTYEQALKIATETNDLQSEGNHLANLGQVYNVLGEKSKAIEHYERALEIAEKTGDEAGLMNRLSYLGQVLNSLGQFDQAITYYQRAYELARGQGNERSQAIGLGELGMVYHTMGETKRAIQYLERALTLSQKLGDRRNEAIHLGNLGNAYRTSRKPEKAIKYYRLALDIAQEIHDRRSEGIHLSNLGKAHQDLDHIELAIKNYEAALEIARETQDRRSEGQILGSLGAAYTVLGQPGRSMTYCDDALVVAREVGDRNSEAIFLANKGMACAALGEMPRAVAYMSAAVRIFESIKSPQAKNARRLLDKLQKKQPIRGKWGFS